MTFVGMCVPVFVLVTNTHSYQPFGCWSVRGAYTVEMLAEMRSLQIHKYACVRLCRLRREDMQIKMRNTVEYFEYNFTMKQLYRLPLKCRRCAAIEQ